MTPTAEKYSRIIANAYRIPESSRLYPIETIVADIIERAIGEATKEFLTDEMIYEFFVEQFELDPNLGNGSWRKDFHKWLNDFKQQKQNNQNTAPAPLPTQAE